MTILARFRRNAHRKAAARALYGALVAQARRPEFYEDCRVPDTVDGRFDMIAIHAFLVLRRLRRDHAETADLSQALFDLMFADMDQNLRQMGVGDLMVGKRIKALVSAFYGRVAAYERGLAGSNAALARALRRNLFRTSDAGDDEVAAMVAYMRRQAAALGACDLGRLTSGGFSFEANLHAGTTDGSTIGLEENT